MGSIDFTFRTSVGDERVSFSIRDFEDKMKIEGNRVYLYGGCRESEDFSENWESSFAIYTQFVNKYDLSWASEEVLLKLYRDDSILVKKLEVTIVEFTNGCPSAWITYLHGDYYNIEGVY